MKWEKCSTGLSDILADAMGAFPAQKRMMFGCPAYFVNGNMFAGVHQSSIILRLTESDRRQIRQDYDESLPFEPFPGRLMKEYMTVPEALFESPADFAAWIGKSIAYAAALPPKTPKPRVTKKEKLK
jgi:TfoX/Sxy family transcriptional regulator of competence genes